jgi:response regulator RpfG family c-di-GMP phosphodiesterase
MAIVDVFDALGGKRSYKDAWPDDKIKHVIAEENGKKFDPQLVDIMIQNFDEFCQFKRDFPD